MKRFTIAAALIAAGATPAPAQPAPVEVTEAQSGHAIRLARGQALTVSVQQCVGCFYHWVMGPLPAALRGGETTEVDLNRRGPPNYIVGGSKTVSYHFTAARAGSGTLTLTQQPIRGPGQRHTVSYRITVR